MITRILSFLLAAIALSAQSTPGALGPPSGAGGGTAQAQTVSFPQPWALATNQPQVCWLPAAANTAAAPTLAVTANGVALAAKSITKLGTTALVANDITTTAVACVIYDGTRFQLQNPQTTPGAGVTYSRGAYASAPSCSGSSFIYDATDDSVTGKCNGTSTTWQYNGKPITPTQASDLGTNYNSAVTTNTPAGWLLTGTNAAGGAWHGKYESVPATPYTVGVCFDPMLVTTTFASAGMGFTDGTALKIDFVSVQGITVPPVTGVGYFYTNSTTYGGSNVVQAGRAASPSGYTCIALSDDGTNWHHLVSTDGITWILQASEARNTTVTATGIGVFISDSSTTANAPSIQIRSLIRLNSAL